MRFVPVRRSPHRQGTRRARKPKNQRGVAESGWDAVAARSIGDLVTQMSRAAIESRLGPASEKKLMPDKPSAPDSGGDAGSAG
jgi:hypothetical protein